MTSHPIDQKPPSGAAPTPQRVAGHKAASVGDTLVPLFLPCAAGTEALLADEVQRILGDEASGEVLRGGVLVEGGALTAMRLNLESRLAQRVLWPLAHGPYDNEHDLYALARTVAWADWITPAQTFRIDTTAQRSPLQSLNFATLRV